MFLLASWTLVAAAAVASAAAAAASEEYLRDAIASLRRPEEARRKVDEEAKATPPTLSLAKDELADFYEKAIQKGNTVKIDTAKGDVNAAVYELGSEHQEGFPQNVNDPSGYYYYYYPLKAFMSELSSGKPPETKHKDRDHEHNIHIIEKPAMEEKPKKKALEPLFMAISGFVGMSVMFILSLLVLPKLSHSKPSKAAEKSENENSLAKVIYQAIEGFDCSERLSCEFGKTTRAFNVHNNRFFKLLRRIGPRTLSKQLYNINKYSNKKHKCAQIRCKPPKPEEPSNKKS